MAAFPVTAAGSVTCEHQGSAPLTTDPRLVVGDQKIVLVPDQPFGPYTGCKAGTPPGVCTSTVVAPPDSGTSQRLFVGGTPVLLGSLQATSTPAGTPVTVKAGQTILTAS